MCLVSEHAHLKKDYLNLQTKNTNLVGKVDGLRQTILELERKNDNLKLLIPKPPPPKPVIALYSMPSEQVLKELKESGLKLMYPVLTDYGQPYFYTNDEGWADVFYYIYTVFDMPDYMAGRMDCEDFAILLKGLVQSLFGLNYFAFTIGMIPEGCHGFNIFRDDRGLMVIEPQSGEFFEWGDRSYNPEWVLI